MVYFQDAYTWLVNDMIYKSLFWPDDFDLDETALAAEKLLDDLPYEKLRSVQFSQKSDRKWKGEFSRKTGTIGLLS